ncbi:MAG: GNAT family N-acetyltransferase [Paracoccaceae bacterium]
MTDGIALEDGVTGLPAAEWDAVACPGGGAARPVDPFTTHRFLSALERSGSVGRKSGWQSRPLVLREGGRIAGAVPLYVKTHSQGEYIFDHGWAEAYERAGGRYYPKLQVSVPFTPVTGRRFLGAEEAGAPLAAALEGVCRSNGLSSVHATFCTQDEAEALAAQGWLHRVTQQYHWESRGYGDFGDFLADLSSRKRKMIRKEREGALAAGLTVHHLTGADLRPEHWDAFWSFYQDTGGRKWGRPYLTRAFFDEIHRTMADDILLILACDGRRPVAGALNFIGRETLYGRYWGCVEDHPFLHFELCYYQAIDWAIHHGLHRVEAGAQGEHKLARGYLPSPVHSAHWIADPAFREAVARYLSAERRAVDEEIEVMTAFGPFRRTANGED